MATRPDIDDYQGNSRYSIDEYLNKYGGRRTPTPTPTPTPEVNNEKPFDFWGGVGTFLNGLVPSNFGQAKAFTTPQGFAGGLPTPEVSTPNPGFWGGVNDFLNKLVPSNFDQARRFTTPQGFSEGMTKLTGVSPTGTTAGLWGEQDFTPVNGSPDYASLIMGADRLGNAATTTPSLYDGVTAGNITEDAGLDNGWDELSYEEAIAQAQAILSGMGYGAAISYDPLRDTARSQWSDADAKTKAMYDQLQGMIRGEAAPLGKMFDTAMADTRTDTTESIGDLNAAAQSSADIKTQQAKALGIEEAVANSIIRGSDPSQDMTRDIADTSARGQITQTGLNENKTSALTRNNDWVASAGLQGAQTRDLRLAELSKVLAQLDVGEQEANSKAQNDWRTEALSLAGNMIGTNRDDLSEMNETQWRAQMGADDAWYDLQRILQGGTNAASSTKPSIMTHDQAIARALLDFNVKDIGEIQNRDPQVQDKFRNYVLTLEGRK